MEIDYDRILRQMRTQDGGLVEVWALDTTYQLWSDVVGGLDRSGYSVQLEKNGRVIPVYLEPDMFLESEDDYYRLSVTVGPQIWTSGLSSTAVVDFQAVPEMVRTKVNVDEIWTFMKKIAQLSQRRVIFIPETLDAASVARYLEVSP
jgi:hypothetical protein